MGTIIKDPDALLNRCYELLYEDGVTSEETVNTVTNINGYHMGTLNDILYAKVGERDVIDYFMSTLENEGLIAEDDDDEDDVISCEMRCDGSKGLVVTDPCYVFQDGQWGELIEKIDDLEKDKNGAVIPQEIEHAGIKMVIADTLFGDWLCELHGIDGKMGTFTADAGMVCLVQMDHDDAKARLKGIRENCWAFIPGFKGQARILHSEGECWVDGHGTGADGKMLAFSSAQIG